MKSNINSYISLIQDFLVSNISVLCFEYAYLRLFKEDNGEMTEEETVIFHQLFMSVEAFCNDPGLRDEDDIDEEQLRKIADRCLKKIRRLVSERSLFKININLYTEVLSALVNKRISFQCFKYLFMKIWGEERGVVSEDEYDVFQKIFTGIQSSKEENELRSRSKVALEKLRALRD